MKRVIFLLLLLISFKMVWALETTPTPVIYYEMTDDACIIWAEGDGEIRLYVEGVPVENPFSLAFGEEEIIITVTATAQQDGMGISDMAVVEITIPIADPNYPPDPHETGYWVVLKDRFGHDLWYQLDGTSEDVYYTVVDLVYSTFGGYNPETSERPEILLYIVKDGLRFGPPSANQSVYLGIASNNPLVESDYCYTIPVGFAYIIGAVPYPGTEDLYLYVAQTWIQDFSEDPKDYITGDVDADAKVTIDDMTTLIDYLLSGDTASFNKDNADVDGSGKISIDDATMLIDYLLTGTWR